MLKTILAAGICIGMLTGCARQPPVNHTSSSSGYTGNTTSDAVWKNANGLPLNAEEAKLLAASTAENDAYEASLKKQEQIAEQSKREIVNLRANRDSGKKLTLAETAILNKADADNRAEMARKDEQDTYLPPSEQRCGLIGCVSSPYLNAKLHPERNGSGINPIGQPLSYAIGIAGVPEATTTVGEVSYLTWRRFQEGMTCQETIAVKNGKIGGYRFVGNC